MRYKKSIEQIITCIFQMFHSATCTQNFNVNIMTDRKVTIMTSYASISWIINRRKGQIVQVLRLWINQQTHDFNFTYLYAVSHLLEGTKYVQCIDIVLSKNKLPSLQLWMAKNEHTHV